MDIKTLTYFLKTCETKSFSRAAREMYISPQGLNRSICQAEKELGVPLFESNNKGVVLTAYGERFERFCNKVIGEYQRLSRDLSSMKESLSHNISIGLTNGSIITIGEDFFLNFQNQHPDINIIYENGTDYELENRLSQGKYNLAIIATPFDTDRFVTIPLIYYDLYAWIHQDNPLSNYDSLEITDLKDQSILTIGETYKIHRTLESLCLKNGFSPNFTIVTNDRYLLLPYTLENLGISIALKREDIFIRSLPIRSVPINGYGVGFGICYPKDHVLTSAENTLIRALVRKTGSAQIQN